MAKKNEYLTTSWSSDGKHFTWQIAGMMPETIVPDEFPANVNKFWRDFGCRQTITNVIAAREKNGWTNQECHRRIRQKIAAFEAGNVESERSPIRNVADVFRAIAEHKTTVTGRPHTVDDIHALQLPMEKLVAIAADPRIVALVTEYESERAKRALAAAPNGPSALDMI